MAAELVSSLYPRKPGYYWAWWTIASEGSKRERPPEFEKWEIVQVNANISRWEDDPLEDEALSVSVPGVRHTQWRDCFVWGPFVCGLEKPT